ncbi:MAG: tetratricopeptide repeat protein [Pirellulales bacterium]|nr:tetratricopeptide repeat protein [Pirellulales bacterium]
MRGTWSGLALAVGFSLLLDGALVVSYAWTELVSPAVRTTAWTVLGACYLASVVAGCRWRWRQSAASLEVREAGLFERARDDYLRGHWLDAETTLHELLARDPRDVDARLLLASLYRRTRRHDEAQRVLARLERLDGGEKWIDEIRRERALLALAQERMAVENEAETPVADENENISLHEAA